MLKELECLVEEIAGLAWRGISPWKCALAAALALGESPEANVFVVPPARGKATRWWMVLIVASLVLMIASLMIQYWQPAWLAGLKPVHATEAEVRAFLNDPARGAGPHTK